MIPLIAERTLPNECHTHWAVEVESVRVGRGQLCLVIRQIAGLLRSGMSLVPALTAIEEQIGFAGLESGRNRRLQEMVRGIRDRVNSGYSLSSAMTSYPQVFEQSMIAAVAAAELTGTLDQVLWELSEQIQQRETLRRQLATALVYPAFLCVVAVSVVVFMLSYVLPGIGRMFTEMDLVLPWPTRVLIGLGNASRHFGPYALLVLLVGAAGLALACRTGRGRQRMDAVVLACPWLGQLVLKSQLATLTMTLSGLLSAGVSLPQALAAAGQVLTNRAIKGAWSKAAQAVQEGQMLAGAVRRAGIFPPLFVHALSSAEDLGGFDGCLAELSRMYRLDLQAATKMLLSILEPVILLVMGLTVGMIVLAVLLPVFTLNQAIG